MSLQTPSPDDRALRPAAARLAPAAPQPGAFSAGADPRLLEIRRGGALGTSMLALYPVFACVVVVVASLALAGPTLPA